MHSFSLNEEEIVLIKELRRITIGQKEAILLAVHALTLASRNLDTDLPRNVVSLIPRAGL